MTWSVCPATSGVHVTPDADQIHHDIGDECACGPTSEPVKRDDGSIGWVITHHSLDGREHRETKPRSNDDLCPRSDLPPETCGDERCEHEESQ